MKRIAIAGFQHETNTFSPIMTTREDFNGELDRDQLEHLGSDHFNSPVSGFYDKAKHFGFSIIPLVDYSAEPSNMVPRDVFDQLLGDILTRIEASDCDGIFLDLHGAMALEGYVDGETEILRAIRSRMGNIPIIASLDLHGNLAPKSVELCSGFVSCREYPHVDMFETGQRCAVIMDHIMNVGKLFHAFRQIPFLMPTSKETTFREPSKSLYRLISDVENRPGVVSASILQGFSGADMEHTGPSVLAYAVTRELAQKAADFLFQGIMDRESEFSSDVPGAEEAIADAIRLSATAVKPVILADIQDNAGGGSSSDTMFVLKELLNQNATGVAAGMIFDPESAAAAHSAGQGAKVELALGGKYIAGDSPLRAAYKIERLYDGIVTGTGPMTRGMQFSFGKMALLRLADILIVVGSRREQAADQSIFTILGVNPPEMKIVLVKSANHFRADFEPISSHVINVLAPGSDVEDPSTFAYNHLRSGVRLKGCGPLQIKK